MTSSPTLDLLGRALDQTGSLIEKARPEQAHLSTPCSDWDLRTLINHIVFDLRLFDSMLRGAQREAPGADLIDDDWSGAYRTAADTLLETWRKRGLDEPIKSQMGELPATWGIGQEMADIAVHGWDVARATGQSTDLDPEIGEVSLAWAKESLKPQFRGQAFGPEVAVPESGSIYSRLAGFFGRDPGT